MVFSSVIFIFFYLVVVLALYYIVPFKWRNVVLFVVNLIFYSPWRTDCQVSGTEPPKRRKDLSHLLCGYQSPASGLF